MNRERYVFLGERRQSGFGNDVLSVFQDLARKSAQEEPQRPFLALFVRKGDYDAAIRHLQDFLSRDPVNVAVNMELSEIYVAQGNSQLARQHLQQVLQSSPQHARALTLLQKIGS